GDMVYVEKGGEIIPKITGVDVDSRVLLGEKVQFPKVCPECGTPLVREAGEAAWYCPNDLTCPPQIKGKIEHFVSRKAMNIDGIGEETVSLLYQHKLLSNVADLYQLKLSDLTWLAGLGEKSGRKMLQGIADSRNVPFERVLFALGIRYVGATVAKNLAVNMRSIDRLASAKKEELTLLDEVGERIAESVVSYFADERHRTLVQRLKDAGLQFEIHAGAEQTVVSDKLKGLSIVISGTFANHSRDELKALIEANGGKNASGVTSKTHYLLAGDNMGPAKREKATSLGVQIISEEEFMQMIE
ncbi:MAG: NAD-dependent DNA ligase LigA, partial [Paludibacteraceae bacterium]|nr:NAD-dependent DNA ligase LigA [Paludibacteraceae bacterium]